MDANCESPRTCSLCKKTEGEPLQHEYDEEILTNATCNTSGEKKLTCSLCKNSHKEPYSAVAFSATEIHDLYANIVGEIITYDITGNELALGSCFVYSEDGMIVTNYHVIKGAYSIKITLAGTEYAVKYVIAYDEIIDIAVLQVEATNLKIATVCEKDHKTGATVYAYGSSKGLTST